MVTQAGKSFTWVVKPSFHSDGHVRRCQGMSCIAPSFAGTIEQVDKIRRSACGTHLRFSTDSCAKRFQGQPIYQPGTATVADLKVRTIGLNKSLGGVASDRMHLSHCSVSWRVVALRVVALWSFGSPLVLNAGKPASGTDG